MLQKLASWLFDKPVYRLSLRAKTADSLKATPVSPWPGNPQAGSFLLHNGFQAPAGNFRPGDPALFQQADEFHLLSLHDFHWLADLKVTGQQQAADVAQGWVVSWMEQYREWHAQAWRPDILASRLINGFHHFAWLGGPQNKTCQTILLKQLPRQAQHLYRTAPGTLPGLPRLKAISGLIHAGLLLPDCNKYTERGLRQLRRELVEQIHPDGGHYQRNPSLHLEALVILCDLRTIIQHCHQSMPEELHIAIDRMAPMLRGYRHGDGGLALFNGSLERGKYPCDLVLEEAGGRARPLASAPHTGIHRLAAGRTLVIVDAGNPENKSAAQTAHAGALSFELSSGSKRIVVNCGFAPTTSQGWQQALRGTPAHSTLTLNYMDSADLPGNDRGNPLRMPDVQYHRREDQRNMLLELSHDGYKPNLGVTHNRALYLTNDGNDFKGEDSLEGTGSYPYCIRFHLHPEVRASLAEGGNTVLLRLSNGKSWKFMTAGGRLKLEDSVYFGSGERRRCQQIVIEGSHADQRTLVRWRFSRE